ncbi:MAG: ATP synthase F1 subunit epsilon [Anaerolineales bacterium]|nr:ATP synthase F1 subunit epsilon [Anaerolineales bacterium]
MPIRCEIVSQDRTVFEGDVDIVTVPGVNGEMGILPNHSPLLSTMSIGVIKVRYSGQEEIFTVTGGLVEIQPTIVTILADAAEHIDEIDISRAEAAKNRAQDLLEQGPPPNTDAYLALEAALRRSNLRLDVVRKYRGSRQSRARSASIPGEGNN